MTDFSVEFDGERMNLPMPQRCRYCGGLLLADGEGGWTCPDRDSHSGGPNQTVEYANAYRSLRRFLWNRFNNCVISGEQREFIGNMLTNFPEPK